MNKEIGTPLNIEILLHCHMVHGKHPRHATEAVQEGIGKLQALGAIEKEESGYYATTPLGDAWVSSMCLCKIPKVVYQDEHGNLF